MNRHDKEHFNLGGAALGAGPMGAALGTISSGGGKSGGGGGLGGLPIPNPLGGGAAGMLLGNPLGPGGILDPLGSSNPIDFLKKYFWVFAIIGWVVVIGVCFYYVQIIAGNSLSLPMRGGIILIASVGYWVSAILFYGQFFN